MKAKKFPKKTIIEILKKHPEGLLLKEIGKRANMSQITTTKYIHELIGEGLIYQRKVGMSKLCYLKESRENSVLKE